MNSLAEARRDGLVLAMAREIHDGDVVGVGLGTPLAVLAGLLARATHAPDSHVLVGGAVDPDADLATCLQGPEALVGRTVGFVPHLDTMHMAEQQAMTLQFLQPAQVDGQGCCNVSEVRPDADRRIRLPGGLAIADVPLLLPRLVVHLPGHRRRSLPAQVDRVTGTGRWPGPTHETRGVVAVLTDLGEIRYEAGGARLSGLADGVTPDEVRERTGFDLHVDGASPWTPPDHPERAALARLDPDGLRHRLA